MDMMNNFSKNEWMEAFPKGVLKMCARITLSAMVLFVCFGAFDAWSVGLCPSGASSSCLSDNECDSGEICVKDETCVDFLGDGQCYGTCYGTHRFLTGPGKWEDLPAVKKPPCDVECPGEDDSVGTSMNGTAYCCRATPASKKEKGFVTGAEVCRRTERSPLDGDVAYPIYGCCPENNPTARTGAVTYNSGKAYIYTYECCPAGVTVHDDPDKTLAGGVSAQSCGCPSDSVAYTDQNGVEQCCKQPKVVREKEGVALCCEASEDIAKNDDGEYVCCDKTKIKDGKCEGCPDGEKAYVNGAGESACCAGELYNCNDKDGDGVTTCECCPKCTGKDDNGEWVPAGCGEVKDE